MVNMIEQGRWVQTMNTPQMVSWLQYLFKYKMWSEPSSLLEYIIITIIVVVMSEADL